MLQTRAQTIDQLLITFSLAPHKHSILMQIWDTILIWIYSIYILKLIVTNPFFMLIMYVRARFVWAHTPKQHCLRFIRHPNGLQTTLYIANGNATTTKHIKKKLVRIAGKNSYTNIQYHNRWTNRLAAPLAILLPLYHYPTIPSNEQKMRTQMQMWFYSCW